MVVAENGGILVPVSKERLADSMLSSAPDWLSSANDSVTSLFRKELKSQELSPRNLVRARLGQLLHRVLGTNATERSGNREYHVVPHMRSLCPLVYAYCNRSGINRVFRLPR